ncbi:MAG: DUF4199 domain-containing protein [Bacteroidales bacterium]
MEHYISVWKANLTNGLILGLIAIAYTLIIYFLNLIFNEYQGYIFYVIQILVLFTLIRSYRENCKHGFITYGQAVASGVVISFYSAVIYAILIYILYAFIDTDLVNKQLAFIEESLIKRGLPKSIIDSGLEIQKKFLQPSIYALTRLFSNFFGGTIITLIIAIFIKKENNPLAERLEINL